MNKIVLFIIPIFCLIAFSGNHFYWVSSLYDGLRIYQIITLVTFSFFSIFTIKNKKNSYFYIFIFLYFLITQWNKSLYIVIFYLLIIISFFYLSDNFKKNAEIVKKITFFIAITPLLSIIYLIPSIILKFQNVNVNWYQSFENFRMLDDSILPCIFLLWYWQSEIKNKLLKLLLSLISILYLLSILFDGGRAVLLSIVFAVTVTSLIRFKGIINFKLIFIELIISIFIFSLIRYNLITTFGSTLIREGASGRAELWMKAILLWIDHPVLGVGGNNFVHQKPYLFSAHPHNYILLWLSEYGLLGLLMVVLSLYFIYKASINIDKLGILQYGMLLAIFTNALLSGSFIYPLSQMINLWCLALVFSKLDDTKPDNFSSTSKTIYIIMILIAIFLIIFYFKQDILCMNCGNYTDFVAPGFWLNGKNEHISQ